MSRHFPPPSWAAAACRLAALLGHYPDAELHVFVDSTALIEALASAWLERTDLPPLGLMVEFGADTRQRLAAFDTTTGALDSIWQPAAELLAYSLVSHLTFMLANGTFGVLFLPKAYSDLFLRDRTV